MTTRYVDEGNRRRAMPQGLNSPQLEDLHPVQDVNHDIQVNLEVLKQCENTVKTKGWIASLQKIFSPVMSSREVDFKNKKSATKLTRLSTQRPVMTKCQFLWYGSLMILQNENIFLMEKVAGCMRALPCRGIQNAMATFVK